MRFSAFNVWAEHDDAKYVFNGVSGGLIRLTPQDYAGVHDFVRGNTSADCSPQLLEQLVLGRILVPSDADELALLSQRYEQSRQDTSHFSLTLVTSLGCNFDCPYCFEAKHPSIMDAEVQAAILNVVDDQMPKIKVLHVSWFGGEPLVGKKPLYAMAEAFLSKCDAAGVAYESQITTNGYLLDEETCKQLKALRIGHMQVGLDGPPEIHNKMRPLAGGKGSFWQIVKNLQHAVNYLPIAIRVNVDTENFLYVEDLFKILQAEGLSGKLTVYPGQLVGVDNAAAPSASYGVHRCFHNRSFAGAEKKFLALAAEYGLTSPSLPRPSGAPCTAVRKNELVVGSKGELYKCWDSVGNSAEVIGDIRAYQQANGRLEKWLKYDPFKNSECRSCIALPVCMGGCAHHGMDVIQYENRCGTFRHNYRETVLNFAKAAESGQVPIRPSGELESRMETR